MNTKLTRTLAAATTAVVALALGACGSDDAKAPFEAHTLKLTKLDTDFKYADVAPKTKLTAQGPERLSMGDQIISRAEYLTAANKHMGDLDITCTVTKAGGFDKASQQCLATITLPGGSLVATVGGFFSRQTGMAIVGGTGKYEGAAGSFTSDAGSSDRSHDVMHVLTPRK
jgi:hypothetical protein